MVEQIERFGIKRVNNSILLRSCIEFTNITYKFLDFVNYFNDGRYDDI